MTTQSLFLQADLDPQPGVVNPNPTQKYRNPRLSIQDREMPALDDFHVRVEMLYAGICGTDLHLTQKDSDTGYIKSSAPVEIPPAGRLIGHEGVGRAVAVGRHVANIRPGDYLTFESLLACQQCTRCRRGNFNQCRESRLLGLEVDGLFSGVADIPGNAAHPFNDYRGSTELPALACLEPAAVAYLACQNAGVRGADRVVVFGAGPIGMYAAIAARLVFGAAEVFVVDPIARRREIAREWCDQTFDVAEFFDSPPAEVDVVVESSGELQNLNRIFPAINANGRAVLLGRCGKPLRIDALDHMITNAVAIIGSRGHLGGAFHDLLALYRRGRFPLGAPVTKTIRGLESLKDHLIHQEKITNENCKVLVQLGE